MSQRMPYAGVRNPRMFPLDTIDASDSSRDDARVRKSKARPPSTETAVDRNAPIEPRHPVSGRSLWTIYADLIGKDSDDETFSRGIPTQQTPEPTLPISVVTDSHKPKTPSISAESGSQLDKYLGDLSDPKRGPETPRSGVYSSQYRNRKMTQNERKTDRVSSLSFGKSRNHFKTSKSRYRQEIDISDEEFVVDDDSDGDSTSSFCTTDESIEEFASASEEEISEKKAPARASGRCNRKNTRSKNKSLARGRKKEAHLVIDVESDIESSEVSEEFEIYPNTESRPSAKKRRQRSESDSDDDNSDLTQYEYEIYPVYKKRSRKQSKQADRKDRRSGRNKRVRFSRELRKNDDSEEVELDIDINTKSCKTRANKRARANEKKSVPKKRVQPIIEISSDEDPHSSEAEPNDSSQSSESPKPAKKKLCRRLFRGLPPRVRSRSQSSLATSMDSLVITSGSPDPNPDYMMSGALPVAPVPSSPVLQRRSPSLDSVLGHDSELDDERDRPRESIELTERGWRYVQRNGEVE